MKTFSQFINEVKKPTGQLKDACWSGYTAVGMKMKGGRKVPNCVPEEVEVNEEVEQIDEISQKTVTSYTAKAYKEYSDRLKNWPAKSAENKAKADKRWKGLTAAAKRGPKTHQVPAGKEPVDKSGRAYWGEETEQLDEKSAAWQRKEGKSPSGGLNKKGVASYRRENPGSKLKTAVTTKPSKLKPGSKAANRRKSFCARMGGMKKRLTSAKTARDPNSRINKSLRKWNC